jgi:DNA-directed RNA polymerase subunit M/transcription elongation factor TFIIS
MTLDYTCPHCGATETYNLVPATREADAPARPVPELDFTCSSCGATDTFQLVKA